MPTISRRAKACSGVHKPSVLHQDMSCWQSSVISISGVQEGGGAASLMDKVLSLRTREDILRLKDLQLAHSIGVFDRAAKCFSSGVLFLADKQSPFSDSPMCVAISEPEMQRKHDYGTKLGSHYAMNIFARVAGSSCHSGMILKN